MSASSRQRVDRITKRLAELAGAVARVPLEVLLGGAAEVPVGAVDTATTVDLVLGADDVPEGETREAAARAKLARWASDPVAFVRECLGAEPDAWQAEALQALVAHDRIGLVASKGVGKTTLLAWAALWYLATRAHPKVICTSISESNLFFGLWAEISTWLQASPLLRATFEFSSERVTSKLHPTTWFIAARSWARSADETQQSATLAGVHADRIMFVVDECSEIPDGVLATASAVLANAAPGSGREAKLLIAGNPTRLSGQLHRAVTSEAAHWWTRRITGDPGDPDRSPRVSVEWAQAEIARWGADSDVVRVNIRALFPRGQANTLIAHEDALAATKREASERWGWRAYPRILGVDVARFGDDRTAIFPRQGPVAFKPLVFRELSTMEVAGQVAALITRWRPAAVFIDATGLGAGVVDRLRELRFDVQGVDFGSRALDPTYLNRRAEMWALMAEWLKTGCVPDLGELVGELAAPTYKFTSSGALQLEAKADLKKRGLPSPDLADALALTFAAPVPMVSELEAFAARWGATEKCITDYDPFAERRSA